MISIGYGDLLLNLNFQVRRGSPDGYESGGVIWSKPTMEKRIGLMNIENTKLREKVKKLEETVRVLTAENEELVKIKKRHELARKHYIAFRKNFDVKGN